MIAPLRLLLMQIKCRYCGKPLSQLEERRLGKISLCPSCFKFITAHKTANSMANSTATNKANNMAHKTANKGQSKVRHTNLTKTARKTARLPLAFWQLIKQAEGD
jgi:ribosome-binding protein aMBF1 (putative translation factor)